MHKSIHVTFSFVSLICLETLSFANVSTSDSVQYRDPLEWPFSASSIWNMPIGSDAVYVHARIERAMSRAMTVDEDVIVMTPEAEIMHIYTNNAGWDRSRSRCPVEGGLLFSAPVPHDFIISPDTWDGLTPNSGLAVLMDDRKSIRQTQPFAHCEEGEIGTSRYGGGDVEDIYGTGYYGAHGGSRLSAIGGTLRIGDLTPDSEPIRHALKVNLYGGKNYYYDEATRGFRWPATSADGYAQENYGKVRTTPAVKECRMGALLALPPWLNLDSLGFETQPARILAEAMRDFGAYIVDDAAWDVYAFVTEWSPEGRFTDEFQKNWGFSFKQSGKNSPWGRDMDRIFLNLYVVDNNRPGFIGGGGTPSVPLAPEFYPTAELTVQTDGTPGASVGPAGTFRASVGIETRIAAYADPGACTFTHWSLLEGNAAFLDSMQATTQVVLDSSPSVIRANFVVKSYSHSTTSIGNGTIEADPVDGVYDFGTEITLTAVPDPGWEFAGWTGSVFATENPLTFSLTGNTDITANFERLYFELTAGTGGQGSINIDPDEDSYPSGTLVTLTAVPDAGWAFRDWTGNLTTEENPLILSMDRNWIIYASFDTLATSGRYADQLAVERGPEVVKMATDRLTGKIIFKFLQENRGSIISVYDLHGRKISEIRTSDHLAILQTSEYQSGIYIALVHFNGSGLKVFKIPIPL